MENKRELDHDANITELTVECEQTLIIPRVLHLHAGSPSLILRCLSIIAITGQPRIGEILRRPEEVRRAR